MAGNFVPGRITSALGQGTEVVFGNALGIVGETLIAVFAATAVTADFTTLPARIQDDSIGNNVYDLIYSQINNAGGASLLSNAVAVYVCNKCGVSGNADIHLQMPTEMLPADVQTSWAAGFSFVTTFPLVAFDAVTFVATSAVDFALVVDQTGSDDLVIAGAFDAGVSGTPTFSSYISGQSPTYSTGNGASGWNEASLALATDIITTEVVVGASTDVFGFILAMSGGGQNTGGGQGQTLVFSINKGPHPAPPPEGRVIATVIIDCTQQRGAIVGLPINYPEYALVGDLATTPSSFVVLEFELEHLFQGSGLSQVRSLMAWSRPFFNVEGGNREDSLWISSQNYPAFLTNLTTMQTVMLGSSAVVQGENENSAFGEFMIVPFPANKHGMRYRFIMPFNNVNYVNPPGKYTLQFANYEIAPMPPSSGSMSGGTD